MIPQQECHNLFYKANLNSFVLDLLWMHPRNAEQKTYCRVEFVVVHCYERKAECEARRSRKAPARTRTSTHVDEPGDTQYNSVNFSSLSGGEVDSSQDTQAKTWQNFQKCQSPRLHSRLRRPPRPAGLRVRTCLRRSEAAKRF